MSSKAAAATYDDVELPPTGLALIAIEELEDVPLPVDAVCTGCKRSAVKCVRLADPRSPPQSFRDVCHACKGVQWWNRIAVLSAIFEETTERRLELLEREEVR